VLGVLVWFGGGRGGRMALQVTCSAVGLCAAKGAHAKTLFWLVIQGGILVCPLCTTSPVLSFAVPVDSALHQITLCWYVSMVLRLIVAGLVWKLGCCESAAWAWLKANALWFCSCRCHCIAYIGMRLDCACVVCFGNNTTLQ
jgi:hypothetical protein